VNLRPMSVFITRSDETPLAALLTAQGLTLDDASRRLTLARGLQVPDILDQVRWVERFAAARQLP
jgi:hypothetical protein